MSEKSCATPKEAIAWIRQSGFTGDLVGVGEGEKLVFYEATRAGKPRGFALCFVDCSDDLATNRLQKGEE